MSASLVAAVPGERSVCLPCRPECDGGLLKFRGVGPFHRHLIEDDRGQHRPHSRGADRESSVEQRSVFGRLTWRAWSPPGPLPSVRSSHATGSSNGSDLTQTAFALRGPPRSRTIRPGTKPRRKGRDFAMFRFGTAWHLCRMRHATLWPVPCALYSPAT